MTIRLKQTVLFILFGTIVLSLFSGITTQARAEEPVPQESENLVVGQSENLTVTVPIDKQGDAIVTQRNDGSWWTTITVNYTGATQVEPYTVERNGISITVEPALFLVASAQPLVGETTSPEAFTKTMDQWDVCRLERDRQVLESYGSYEEYANAFETDSMNIRSDCAFEQGLGEVYGYKDGLIEEGDSLPAGFMFEFIRETPATFTYEIPVGRLGKDPWVGVNTYSCLWPGGYESFRNDTETQEQIDQISQIGGINKLFENGAGQRVVPCLYDTLESTKIAVPLPQTIAPLPGPPAVPGSLFSASGFSWLAPLQPSSTGSQMQIDLSFQQVLVTSVAGLVLVILIALPTQLLDSTLSNNETKIAQSIRKILPSGSRDRIEKIRQQNLDTATTSDSTDQQEEQK